MTIEGSLSNAIVEVTSITPSALSNFSLSNVSNYEHTTMHKFDYDATVDFSYGDTTFKSDVTQTHYTRDHFQIVGNTKTDSKINDTFFCKF